MDASELSRLQDSGARVQCGGITGTVAGFRVAGDAVKSLRLLDANGEHEVRGEVVVLDAVDEQKVAKARKDRDDEDDRALAGTAVGLMRAHARGAGLAGGR